MAVSKEEVSSRTKDRRRRLKRCQQYLHVQECHESLHRANRNERRTARNRRTTRRCAEEIEPIKQTEEASPIEGSRLARRYVVLAPHAMKEPLNTSRKMSVNQPGRARLSSTQWINGLKEGDSNAAEKLWERYYQEVVRLARRRLVSSGQWLVRNGAVVGGFAD